MKIIKLDEEVTFKKVVKTISVGVGEKKVNVYYESFEDLYGDYESDYNIDDKDRELLTEDELEQVEDYLPELLNSDVGHYIDIK